MNSIQINRWLALSLLLWVSLHGCSNLPPESIQSRSGHPIERHTSDHTAATAEPAESVRPNATSAELDAKPAPSHAPSYSAVAHDQKPSSQEPEPDNHLEHKAESRHQVDAEAISENHSQSKSIHPREPRAEAPEVEPESHAESKGSSDESSETSSAKKLADLVEDLKTTAALASGIPSSDLLVQEAKAVEWSDSCLGAPQPDEVCAQVITPGYRIVLSDLTTTFEFHTDRTGHLIRQIRPQFFD